MNLTRRHALIACLLLPLSLCAQTPATSPNTFDPNANAVEAPRRTFMQWPQMKGPKTQIFIDLNGKEKRVYQGANPQLGASLLIQLSGDGGVSLMRYQGTGADWQWTPVEAHAVLTHPTPGVDKVEFDVTPLGPNPKPSVLFQSLDNDWKMISVSKILPWKPEILPTH
jgi:hypothetical protein